MSDETAFRGFRQNAFELLMWAQTEPSLLQREARRAEFERDVRGPMLALAQDLEPSLGPFHVYNLHRAPVFWYQQTAVFQAARDVGYLVRLTFEGLTLQAGWFKARPEKLTAFRDSVASPVAGSRLEAIIRDLERAGWTLALKSSVRVPQPFPANHTRAALLRARTLVANRDCYDLALVRAEAANEVLLLLQECRPLVDWLLAQLDSVLATASSSDSRSF